MESTNDHEIGSVYNSRPYHAISISDDGADDDVRVWQDGPSFSDFDSPPVNQFQAVEVEVKNEENLGINANNLIQDSFSDPNKTIENWIDATDNSQSHIDPSTGKLTNEAFREREIHHIINETIRNLTHVSQFLLKLEVRAGKTTKEAIRQTLDATTDTRYKTPDTDGGPPDFDKLEELRYMSRDIYKRLYLVDRHWRNMSRKALESDGRNPSVEILGDKDVKRWVEEEIRVNNLSTEETLFFTVKDLSYQRSFRDWVTYLEKLGNFGKHLSDQNKLVNLAWRFLDRSLRPPRPVNPTTVEQFIADLDQKRRSGAWDEIRKNPKRQEEDDLEALKLLKRYWSSRNAPI
ncbi:hypothetical protein F4808DRAFT_456910 [Astrocystis sublimbata]|nr:hypothetical protein F4808DRAFT_456910 [Astrocystis sublimbata]